MPICPTCRNEFVEGTTRCPSDGSALVDDLPLPDEEEDFLEIYLVADPLEADLVRNILADDAIHSMARDVDDRMFPTHTNIQDGIRIGVPGHLARRAIEVIRKAREDGALPESGVFLEEG